MFKLQYFLHVARGSTGQLHGLYWKVCGLEGKRCQGKLKRHKTVDGYDIKQWMGRSIQYIHVD